MRELTDSERRVLLALVQDRDRATDAVELFVRFLGNGMERPTIERRPDGFYLVDRADQAEKED